MKILIVEDDNELGAVLKLSLERECFAVDHYNDGESGSYAARTNEYDLILLDHMLPNVTGGNICEELRARKITTPIIMLTHKNDTRLKVECLSNGADDYVCKPFSFEELLARIRALLRRPKGMGDAVLSCGSLSLDTQRHIIKRGNRRIDLTRKEYALLEYLLRNKERVVSRGMILEHVWDSTGDLFSNSIEVHIGTLRRKIESADEPRILHTVTGRGYKIDMVR